MASTSGLQHRCVFVGNIPYDATEEHLIQICEEVGPVVSFRLVLDKETGRPKGYGFCEYKDEETALSARRNLQGYEINGRQLRVDFAENDKGVDRNREQGRGGPGLTSSTDSQKSLAGQPFVGDAALHQLLVLPQAAASVMAEALGGPQSSNLPQFRNGLPSVPGSGNDLLTNYLANMSRYQLNEIMLEMKNLATKNRAQAQQLLQAIPQLTKALFQAQIMLGMVTPQMMQVAGNQKTLSAVAKPSVQDNKQDLKSVTPYLGQVALYKEAAIETFSRPSEAQGKIVLPNSAVFQHSSLPPKHIPLHTYRPPLPQNQVPVEGAIPGIAGVAMPPNVQAPPLPTSRSSLQVLPSLLHHSRPGGTKSIGHQHQGPLPNASLQQSFFSHPLTSQIASLNYPLLSSGLEMLSREARPSQSSLDLTSTSRIRTEPSSVGLVKQNEMSNKEIGLSSNPSKRPRLEEGVGTQISNPDGLQHTQKQMPQGRHFGQQGNDIFKFFGGTPTISAHGCRLVHWIKPSLGEMKINIDGAFSTSNQAGCGGIFRDDSGKCCAYFFGPVPALSPFHAELFSCYWALRFASRYPSIKFWLESDSLLLIKLLNSRWKLHVPWYMITLANKTIDLYSKLQIIATHIYREANSVADLLAGRGCVAAAPCMQGCPDRSLLAAVIGDNMEIPYIRRSR